MKNEFVIQTDDTTKRIFATISYDITHFHDMNLDLLSEKIRDTVVEELVEWFIRLNKDKLVAKLDPAVIASLAQTRATILLMEKLNSGHL